MHFRDMLKAISLIEEFTVGMDVPAYIADLKTQAASSANCKSSPKLHTASNPKTNISALAPTGARFAAWETSCGTITTALKTALGRI